MLMLESLLWRSMRPLKYTAINRALYMVDSCASLQMRRSERHIPH